MVAGVYCNRLYSSPADNEQKGSQGIWVQGILLNQKISFEMSDAQRYPRRKIKGVIVTASHLASGIS